MRISGVSPADVSLLLVWLKRLASSEAEFDQSPVGQNRAS
jgi:hypothetical protein